MEVKAAVGVKVGAGVKVTVTSEVTVTCAVTSGAGVADPQAVMRNKIMMLVQMGRMGFLRCRVMGLYT